MTDAGGVPLAATLTGANRHDVTQLLPLVDAIPPIGANVWVEYEGGDPNYPVWVGCFWGPEDILHTGPAAFHAALNTVNIGKFNLGFASIGICEHALYEAISHAGAEAA